MIDWERCLTIGIGEPLTLEHFIALLFRDRKVMKLDRPAATSKELITSSFSIVYQ